MHLLAQYSCSPDGRVSHRQPPPSKGQSRCECDHLLTDDPATRRGRHWFWTRIIPEMANLLTGTRNSACGHPKSRPTHKAIGPKVGYITFPWSNENPRMRTLTEHLYAPLRLPLSKIDVTAPCSPRSGPPRAGGAHQDHARPHRTAGLKLVTRLYRRPASHARSESRTLIILNSESLQAEVHHYLDVDPAQSAPDPRGCHHDLFKPAIATRHGPRHRRYGVTRALRALRPSLWRYKNAAG